MVTKISKLDRQHRNTGNDDNYGKRNIFNMNGKINTHVKDGSR